MLHQALGWNANVPGASGSGLMLGAAQHVRYSPERPRRTGVTVNSAERREGCTMLPVYTVPALSAFARRLQVPEPEMAMRASLENDARLNCQLAPSGKVMPASVAPRGNGAYW
ncbi:hypothetical protein HBF32_13055 [Luteibacter yeojuensis]|uniref:Uncharacterized protein n=1 Tax=Luteibacter yeojuensis TaxID=345309 RepID=A0A7X5QVX1_9GAMM|nr:hypothetical protein [Luteibacter yeojuensis]